MSPTLLLLALAPGFQLKLHVDGDGMFRFARGSQAVYSTDAVLLATSGVLATLEGYPMLPQIHVPSDGIGVQVQMDGTVTVSGKPAGRIVLASFGNTQLQKLGAYLTSTSRSSIGYPGEGVFGVIRTASGKQTATPAVAKPAATESNGCIVEVALHSETDQEHILLGDIATISGSASEKAAIESLDLGTTPIFGAQRGITRLFIVAKLKNEGINTDKIEIACPIGATVVRKGQKVDDTSVIAAAIDGAKTKLGINYDLRSERGIPDVFVPSGDVQFNTVQAVAENDGATVQVEIDVAGRAVNRLTVKLVPTQAVQMVHMGDPVKVQLIKNGAIVEVSGKARANGRVGGTITVETEGQAVFTGILKSTSLVEVKL